MKTLAIQKIEEHVAYFDFRRNEQICDNWEREGSRSRRTALGVDYHQYRKETAAILRRNVRHPSLTAIKRITRQHLNSDGKQFFDKIVATGVAHTTVLSWMNKYKE